MIKIIILLVTGIKIYHVWELFKLNLVFLFIIRYYLSKDWLHSFLLKNEINLASEGFVEFLRMRLFLGSILFSLPRSDTSCWGCAMAQWMIKVSNPDYMTLRRPRAACLSKRIRYYIHHKDTGHYWSGKARVSQL